MCQPVMCSDKRMSLGMGIQVLFILGKESAAVASRPACISYPHSQGR